ncbi:hypothetical protein HN615_08490 [Candidatus Woesearchaeota archaeon]|jgi:hypothetical protein|nr:hypothetical protein [Candidatus Woesearchaeota archaeon]
MSDFKVFEGKSLSDVFKDIYDNSTTNKKQLDILIKEIVGFIKDGDTAVQLIPAVKEYLEIKVKNDEQLVKMASIVQRLVSSESKGSEDEFGLSDKEKEQLVGSIEKVAQEAQEYTDVVNSKEKVNADN